MLDEIAASLCLQATTTTSHEVQASLVDTPPAMAPQYTTDSPPLSPVQGSPPQMGQPVVTDAEALGEDGEVWPPGFEPGTSTPTQDGHSDGQATPDPSTPTKDGQADSDATPTPREAAQRLARFTEEVQLKRRSPLIVTPPRQKAATKRPLPTRSRRIAAQPLAHIPTSKRGEVFLMQRMGTLSQVIPTSSASKTPSS